jgi:hypothetical protein
MRAKELSPEFMACPRSMQVQAPMYQGLMDQCPVIQHEAPPGIYLLFELPV